MSSPRCPVVKYFLSVVNTSVHIPFDLYDSHIGYEPRQKYTDIVSDNSEQIYSNENKNPPPTHPPTPSLQKS